MSADERPPFDGADIGAVVFDVVGTLVDEGPAWETVSRRLATEARVRDAEKLRSMWATVLDERMTAIVEGRAPWRPHREVVADAAREAVARAGGVASRAGRTIAASLDGAYPAWADAAPATAALRRHRMVAALSNADLDALARLAHTQELDWDIALSTGAVATFKPAPAAYRYAIDALRLDPARTLFVAAHPWDLRAAALHGFRTAYLARPGAEPPSPEDRFDVQADDVRALVDVLAS